MSAKQLREFSWTFPTPPVDEQYPDSVDTSRAQSILAVLAGDTSALMSSFTWADTPQQAEYWADRYGPVRGIGKTPLTRWDKEQLMIWYTVLNARLNKP